MSGIFVNELGYLPEGPKMASATAVCGQFLLLNERNEAVFAGKPLYTGPDATSGDEVYTLDFSEFKTPGTYRLKAGEALSPLFTIGADIYDKLNAALCKMLYFQRCGCALHEKYAGVYTHDVCHRENAVLYENESVEIEVCGGWHDAGDYGRYVTPGAVAVSHILLAYEQYPQAFTASLNIPESGCGMPDILSECLYELRWLTKMTSPDGGAYHKLTTWVHAPFEMPEEDRERLIVFPVSSMATGALTGCMAQAARIYETFSPADAKRFRETALAGYGWLKRHPEFIGFENPDGCNTGGYGDFSDIDERYWAAAELYRLTGEETYLTDCEALLKENFGRYELGWMCNGGFGTLALLMSDAPEGIKNELKTGLKETCDRYIEVKNENGYGVSLTGKEFVWGSNMIVGNHAMLLAFAADCLGNKAYRDAALDQLNYLLGRNALGVSYVTGFGEHGFKHPHLRPAACDGIDEPMPGYVSGGPNGHPGDPVAVELIPAGTPPMKCWADRTECYSLNEICIYWNSPFICACAAFSEGR